MRVCKSCGKEKDANNFLVKRPEEEKCKKCLRNEALERYRIKNRNILAIKNKIYSSKNKDKIKKYMDEYRGKNKDKTRDYNKDYHKKNYDIIKLRWKKDRIDVGVLTAARNTGLKAEFFYRNYSLFQAYRELLLLKRLINEKRTGTQG